MNSLANVAAADALTFRTYLDSEQTTGGELVFRNLIPCFKCIYSRVGLLVVLLCAGSIPKELGALAELKKLMLNWNDRTCTRQGIHVVYPPEHW